SQTLGKSAFYYAVLLDNNNILRVSKETSSMTGIIIHALPLLFVLCIMLFIICIVFSHMLTKSIVKPIENLAQNLDNTASAQPEVYKELIPFVTTIQKQHTDIKRNANLRQEFTANVSHELKTPLTSISGYSELIESGMATNDDVRRFAGEIHKSSKRLLTLINDIIRLSQLDRVTDDERFEPVNLYETAKNCVEMLEKSASDHQIPLNLTGKDVVINANHQMMDELIYNLCDNAIRYNNPGGTVNVSLTSNENNVILEVKDTGIGIPKEHQDRIFERFYRVDKSRSKSTGGTGLGLAIVKHIVAKHNAEIELESEVGKGTTIRVIFALNR
ncbi:MAG: ATP-binding protein, partial [Lachnospira sp.]|nr:ATP-binding protein [Lachnospira sp.]